MGLLKGGQIGSAFSRERMELIRRISIFKRLIFCSDNEVLSTRDKCARKEVLHINKLEVQGTINFLDRLEQELIKLEDGAVVKIGESVRSQEVASSASSRKRSRKDYWEETKPTRKSTREKKQPQKLQEAWVSEERELVTQVGARVDVMWTQDDLNGTKLKPGWYEGEVQEYDDDEDVIRVLY